MTIPIVTRLVRNKIGFEAAKETMRFKAILQVCVERSKLQIVNPRCLNLGVWVNVVGEFEL